MFDVKDDNFKINYQEEMYKLKKETRDYIFSLSAKRRIVKPLLKYGLFKGYLRKKCPYSYGVIDKNTNYFSKNKIAVYTGVFGNYDNIYTPKIKPDNIDYFIFSDNEIKNPVWKYRELKLPEELGQLSNAEKNRYIKMHPHILFPEYKYSIYVDGSIEIITDFTEFIYKNNKYGFSLHKHYERNCAYDEIDKCIDQKKCSVDELIKYKEKLEKEGFPHQFGLLEAPVLVREHNNKKCIDLMNSWWDEYKNNIKRDQLALIYLVWKNEINPNELSKLGDDVHANYAFIHHSHN